MRNCQARPRAVGQYGVLVRNQEQEAARQFGKRGRNELAMEVIPYE